MTDEAEQIDAGAVRTGAMFTRIQKQRADGFDEAAVLAGDLAVSDAEKRRFKTERDDLETKLKVMTAERDALKAERDLLKIRAERKEAAEGQPEDPAGD